MPVSSQTCMHPCCVPGCQWAQLCGQARKGLPGTGGAGHCSAPYFLHLYGKRQKRRPWYLPDEMRCPDGGRGRGSGRELVLADPHQGLWKLSCSLWDEYQGYLSPWLLASTQGCWWCASLHSCQKCLQVLPPGTWPVLTHLSLTNP